MGEGGIKGREGDRWVSTAQTWERDGTGLDKGLSGSYWMGRLTARVIERVSECHPLQELQMKKEIPSFYAVYPIFKWKNSDWGLKS